MIDLSELSEADQEKYKAVLEKMKGVQIKELYAPMHLVMSGKRQERRREARALAKQNKRKQRQQDE
jgi:hypothetical protein